MSPAVITLLVLLVMVVFFVTEKLPAALVAMLGGSVLVLCGIIDPAELFSAFSGSTIVLVAAMMVVGSALFHTGIAAKMADVLVKFTGTSENGIMIAFMLVATIISAVCSGVAVVAMLLPIVISVSQRAGVSVSRQLIPMSFAASFGCNLTLMGAASNVVVNGALEDLGVPTMTFFELGKVGIPVSIAGIVFFLTIGKRFLTPGDTSDREYLAEYTGSNKAVEFNAVKAGLCLVILAVLLVAMAIDSDSFPMYLVAAFAAFVLVLTGCISQSDAYKSIDLSTLFIVAGMSAVSTGMSKSGAGALIADTAVNLLGEHPNKLLVLLYYYLLKYKGWHGPAVRNLATTHLLDRVAAAFGETCYEVPVGFKYISAKMKETGAILGGESSGGLTVAGHINGKDGVYAASLLVEMLAVTGKKLSELMAMVTAECGQSYMEEYSCHFTKQVKEELMHRLFTERELPDMSPYEVDHVSYLDGCKVYFKNGGWVIARFSGTEPLLRVFCEMDTMENAEKIAKILTEFLSL